MEILSFILFYTLVYIDQTKEDIKVHTALQVRHPSNQHWIERTSSARYVTPSTVRTTSYRLHNAENSLSINLSSDSKKNTIRRKELQDQPQLPNVYPQAYLNYPINRKLPNDEYNQHEIIYPYGVMNPLHNLPSWYSLRYRRYPREEPHHPYNDNNLQLPWNYKPKCRSCGRPLLQDSFCVDDFVLRVYIYKESVEPNGQRNYLAYIYQVYKDTKHLMQPTLVRHIIYNCDRFQTGPIIGEVYLITGIYISDVPHVDSCSWKSPWSQVTREQKRYLRKRYSVHCGICRLQRVLFIDPFHHRNPNTCYLPISPNSNEMMCRDKFSLCRLQRRINRCNFTNNKSYRICETWSSKHI
ncbi:Metalloproteinase inhibitor 1 [Schistosoma japonicum]|nr:Metalloproteinase inhibitor 1 [Schistosoma japonicum]